MILYISEQRREQPWSIKKALPFSVENGGNMKRRLQDLGVIRDTEIGCVLDSISGDIKVYMIRGAYIAIRKSDAEQILLK